MKTTLKQEKFFADVIDNLKVPTIAQIKALELFLSTSSDKINSEEKDLIELTLNSCNNMQKMIDNFSFISKLNSQKINLNYKYFNFNELIKSLINEANILLKYSNLNINLFLNNEIEIFADIVKIKKAIENMLSYVINHAVKNSKITVILSKTKDEAKFEIISKSYMADSKEFLQILKQNQQYCPKYMELFISKEIIKAHFGKAIFKILDNNIISLGFLLPIK